MANFDPSMLSERKTIDVIPVPPGWSPEQSWEQISRGVLLPTDYPEEDTRWAILEVKDLTYEGNQVTGGRLVKLHNPEDFYA